MAEAIQLQLEGMLPELEDLKLRKLFNEQEIQSIVKKRTHFEYQLKRRSPYLKDFLKYIEYEIQLDQLRKQRKIRLQPQAKTSVSDFSLQRRIFNLFERALLKFRNSIPLWLSYIEYCNSNNSTKLVSKIFSRALQFHPRNSTLWILASHFEFSVNLNMTSARALMQRSIRLDPNDQKLWLEYFRLEVKYVEKIRLRRELMSKGKDLEEEVVEADDMIALPDATDDQLVHKEPISLSEEVIKSLDDDGDFMKGLLPKIIYKNAIKTIPHDIEFRTSFLEIYQQFPHLASGMEEVYESIEKDFNDEPEAIDLTIRRDMDTVSASSDNYGKQLKSAIQQYEDILKLKPSPQMFECYVKFLNGQFSSSPTEKLKSFFLFKLNQQFKLLQNSEDGTYFNEFTFGYYLNFVVDRLKDPKLALELSVKASEKYPQILTFWLTQLELIDDEDLDKKIQLIESALNFNILEDELWDAYWTHHLSRIQGDETSDSVQALFYKCHTKCAKYITKSNDELQTLNSIQFKLFTNCLNWYYDHQGIDAVRELSQRLSKNTPFTHAHYQHWISLELASYYDQTEKNTKDVRPGFLWFHERKVDSQVKDWIKKIVHLYELALRHRKEEDDPIDLWYDYLTFLNDMQQHQTSAEVLNRCKQHLTLRDFGQLQVMYRDYLAQSHTSKEFDKFDNEVVISH